MILTKEEEIGYIREAGKLAGMVLELVTSAAKPGITTWELDVMAEKAIRDAGHIPTFKGYRGFPATVCISVNEEVVHGIPNKKKVLKDGDVVSLDLGVTVVKQVNGKPFNFIGDTAITVPIGFSYGHWPAGMTFLGRAFDEGRLIRLAFAYEQGTHHRKPPVGFD